MKWYVSEIIVQCSVGATKRKSLLYERQIKIFKAGNSEDAYKRALKLGKQENFSYRNTLNQIVHWKFIALVELDVLDEKPKDGSEIYYSISRRKPKNEIKNKKDLSVFWCERNKSKPAIKLVKESKYLFPK